MKKLFTLFLFATILTSFNHIAFATWEDNQPGIDFCTGDALSSTKRYYSSVGGQYLETTCYTLYGEIPPDPEDPERHAIVISQSIFRKQALKNRYAHYLLVGDDNSSHFDYATHVWVVDFPYYGSSSWNNLTNKSLLLSTAINDIYYNQMDPYKSPVPDSIVRVSGWGEGALLVMMADGHLSLNNMGIENVDLIMPGSAVPRKSSSLPSPYSELNDENEVIPLHLALERLYDNSGINHYYGFKKATSSPSPSYSWVDHTSVASEVSLTPFFISQNYSHSSGSTDHFDNAFIVDQYFSGDQDSFDLFGKNYVTLTPAATLGQHLLGNGTVDFYGGSSWVYSRPYVDLKTVFSGVDNVRVFSSSFDRIRQNIHEFNSFDFDDLDHDVYTPLQMCSKMPSAECRTAGTSNAAILTNPESFKPANTGI